VIASNERSGLSCPLARDLNSSIRRELQGLAGARDRSLNVASRSSSCSASWWNEPLSDSAANRLGGQETLREAVNFVQIEQASAHPPGAALAEAE